MTFILKFGTEIASDKLRLDACQADGRCLGNDINPVHAAGLRAGTQISSLQRLSLLSSSSSSSTPLSFSPSIRPCAFDPRTWTIWNERAGEKERRESLKHRTQKKGKKRARARSGKSERILNRICDSNGVNACVLREPARLLLLLHRTHAENTMLPHLRFGSCSGYAPCSIRAAFVCRRGAE